MKYTPLLLLIVVVCFTVPGLLLFISQPMKVMRNGYPISAAGASSRMKHIFILCGKVHV